MDRSYKAPDLVHVHQSSWEGERLAVFQQVPHSIGALDYYFYKEKLYPGFERIEDGYVYILLDKRVQVHGGIYRY